MIKKAVLFLADGFEEMEALTPVDVLRRAGVEVTVAGISGKSATGAHGVTVQADIALSELTGNFDLLIFPGGMPGSKNLGESAKAKELAIKHAGAGKLIAAICAAPVFTLGAWGILDGKTATCYPGMDNLLPAGVKFSPDRVVVDGNVITSRGPGTATEFSLALVEKLVDKAMVQSLSNDMVVKQ
jgi:DJ-1 family protein